ncbi:Thioredoxin-like fold [Phaffia rhodozyma]|uniref:Thioredoxin-like fold n=1 Tax=Phaffia rhodozyma TaxID=264483 RepID=A0A0F7SEX3_PHARH|nr:Thioredoxin-like fold [Phaffia rhodozyma]
MAFWRKPRFVITLFHNPNAPISYEALIMLRKSQLYNKVDNPYPVDFDLDVIEPPMGMTETQRRSIINALEIKERNRIKKERERSLAERGGKVADEVKKNKVDWSEPLEKVSIPSFRPPLVVSWHTNEVASGSMDDVKEILESIRKDQYSGKDMQKEPGLIQDLTRRAKALWRYYV